MNEEAQKTPKAGNAKKAMKEAIRIAGKLGSGAADLLRRMKKDRSPEAMIRTLDENTSANTARREEVSGRVERVYHEIAAKKAEYQKAPKARQRILEAELRSLLSTYKASERELNILLENERNLSLIKGRLNEVAAYGMSGVSEILIDDVIDDIEAKVTEAEAVADATRDLEKAGKRKQREEDTEDLWTALGEFGEEEQPSGLTEDLAGFEVEQGEGLPADDTRHPTPESPNPTREE